MITGPEAFTYADAADKLSSAIGRKVTYVRAALPDTPLEAATQAMLDGGAPVWLAEGQAEQFRYRCPGKTVPRDIDHRGYRPETSGDVRRFRARVRSYFRGEKSSQTMGAHLSSSR